MKRDEGGPLHVPVGLLALRLQVDAVGEALVEEPYHLAPGGLRQIVLRGIEPPVAGRDGRFPARGGACHRSLLVRGIPFCSNSVFRKAVVRIAVQPALARLRRGNHGMAGGACVFRGVLVGRAVAAQRRPALLAGPQMHPLGSHLHALRALRPLRLPHARDGGEGRAATLGHSSSSCYSCNTWWTADAARLTLPLRTSPPAARRGPKNPVV